MNFTHSLGLLNYGHFNLPKDSRVFVNLPSPEEEFRRWLNVSDGSMLIFYLNERVEDSLELSRYKQTIYDMMVEHGFRPEEKLLFLTNMTASPKMGFDRIEWFEYQTFLRHLYDGHAHANSWNSDASKALFKPGKLYRPHRTVMLDVLIKSGLLEKFDYGFRLPEKNTPYWNDIDQACHELIGSGCETLREYERDIDIDGRIAFDEGNYHYTGFPYDSKTYENTLFSLISETEFRGSHYLNEEYIPWLTEKTFMPIINKHPFILIGQWEAYPHLRNMGYETFLEFIPSIPNMNFGSLRDNLAEAILEFFNNCRKYKNGIREMVEHNYNLFQSRNQTLHERLLEHSVDTMSLPEALIKKYSYRNYGEA